MTCFLLATIDIICYVLLLPYNECMKKNISGFTLVELIIVIVVIAILAAIMAVTYNGIQNRAIDATVISDMQSNIKKMRAYKDVNNSWPTEWGQMVAPPHGVATSEFALAGTKSSIDSITVCFYTPNSSFGWPAPNNATGEILTAISKTGSVFAATTDSPGIVNLTSQFNAVSNPSSSTACSVAATYFNVYRGGVWNMTPYMTWASK